MKGASSVVGDADLAAVGALLAEPARARVLLALADGRSLAASILADEAGVAPSTASHHLARLCQAGFIRVEARGRHRYFSLASQQVAELVEAAARIAPPQQVRSLRQGNRAYALRYARSCYDHLAGRLGVAVTDALRARDVLDGEDGSAVLTVSVRGAERLTELGISARPGESVKCCLDWTEQREHIAGPVGRSLLRRMLELGWLARTERTRALRLTDVGRAHLRAQLGIDLP